MRTQTTTSTTTLKLPRTINFLGNKNGCVVKRLSENNYTGDGDINTGHGGKVYTAFVANCEAEGASAKISVTYQVWNSDYGTAKNADCLFFKGVHYESLSNYDKSSTWTYATEKGELATVNERLTYKLLSHPEVYHYCFYHTKDSRKGWLKVDNDLGKARPQSWAPMEHMRFKIDDSGNELTKEGNIGVKLHFILSVQVTRTVTTTILEKLDDEKTNILNRDKNLTTLDAVLNNRPIITYEDGVKSFANNAIHDSGTTGALLRGERQEQLGVTTYTFPFSSANLSKSTGYYLGSIIVADGKMRTNMPTKVPMYDYERKPLRMLTTLYRAGLSKSFNDIVPTAQNMNNRRLEFIQEYRSRVNGQTLLPSQTIIGYKDFESTDGIAIGGTIKGINFGFTAADRTKRVRVFEFKQVLYSMSLDDTYKKGSDYFTDRLDLATFKQNIGHYSPAIISTVYYGRVAYLAVASDNFSAATVSINDYSGRISGVTSGCTFKAIVLGGAAGTANGTMDFTNVSNVSNFLKELGKEMTAVDVEAALPIEFEASYLRNPAKLVTTNIYPYYTKLVDKIKVTVWESNKGASMTARLRFIDYAYNSRGVRDYTFSSYNRELDYTVEASPWACCFEIIVSIKGNYDNDFNIFIPYIPLDKIRQNEKGEWEFKIHITGSTLYNAKNNIELSYTVPGAFVSKNDNWFRGELKDSEYVGKSEEYILTQYFNYCEDMYSLYDNFQRLTGEKTVKTRRE